MAQATVFIQTVLKYIQFNDLTSKYNKKKMSHNFNF